MENKEIKWMTLEESYIQKQAYAFLQHLVGLPLTIESYCKYPSRQTTIYWLEVEKERYESQFKKDGSFMMNWIEMWDNKYNPKSLIIKPDEK